MLNFLNLVILQRCVWSFLPIIDGEKRILFNSFFFLLLFFLQWSLFILCLYLLLELYRCLIGNVWTYPFLAWVFVRVVFPSQAFDSCSYYGTDLPDHAFSGDFSCPYLRHFFIEPSSRNSSPTILSVVGDGHQLRHFTTPTLTLALSPLPWLPFSVFLSSYLPLPTIHTTGQHNGCTFVYVIMNLSFIRKKMGSNKNGETF